MRITTTVKDNFNASHLVEGDPVCIREHMHNWEVAVSVESKIRANSGLSVDTKALLGALNSVVDEIRGSHLNVSLPDIPPTSEQLAIYIHERLILAFPAITAVQVDMGVVKTSRVEWELR